MPKIYTPNNLPRIFDRAVRDALDKTAKRLSDEFDTQINTSKWPWERGTTVRKKRPPVSSPRDIVDTTDLRESKVQEDIDPYGVKWTWKTDYSSIVHEGGKFMDGSDYPERPWTKGAEEEVNIQEYFADILRRELDG